MGRYFTTTDHVHILRFVDKERTYQDHDLFTPVIIDLLIFGSFNDDVLNAYVI